MAFGFKSVLPWFARFGGRSTAAYPDPTAAGVPTTLLDDSLWLIVVGSTAQGWRDITDECPDLVYSNVRSGGPASCSFTSPADIWGMGANELRPDMRVVVRYAGEVAFFGTILPRSTSYTGA